MPAKQLTRRAFLTASLGVGAMTVLAACAPKAAPTEAPKPAEAPQATEVPKPTEQPKPAASAAQEIHFLCRSDIKPAFAADKAVEEWNAKYESKVTIDEPAGEVDAKIQAAQAAGDLVWDGYATIEFPMKTTEWVKRGLMVPIDDYVTASTVPGADKVLPGVVESIRYACQYEGKQYGVPGNVAGEVLQWYWEPVRKAGFETQPITWDENYECAKKIKETSPEYTPFSVVNHPLAGLWAMMWGAMDDPYDSDGLVDIRGKTAIDILTWYRKMVDEELMPYTTKDQWSNWMKQGIALFQCWDVGGTMAQQTFGVEAADTGTNIFPTKDSTHAGTPFNINAAVLLNKAKNPQGMVDFYLHWFGPENKGTGKQITEVAAKPCYQYTYDEFVKPNPLYAWQSLGIELIKTSKPFRTDTWWQIQMTITGPYVEMALDPANKFEPQKHMDECYQAIKDEIAKQKI